MTANIRDIPITLSYDKVCSESTKNKKKLRDLKKFPKKNYTSALSLIAKYLNTN